MSVGLLVSRSVGPSVCRTVRLSIPSARRSCCRSGRSVSLLVCRSIDPSVDYPTLGLLAYPSEGLSVCRSVGQSVGWLVGLSIPSVTRSGCRSGWSVSLLVCRSTDIGLPDSRSVAVNLALGLVSLSLEALRLHCVALGDAFGFICKDLGSNLGCLGLVLGSYGAPFWCSGGAFGLIFRVLGLTLGCLGVHVGRSGGILGAMGGLFGVRGGLVGCQWVP